VGVPFSETKDYVAKTSWLGFSIEGRQFVTGSITLGISAGWQTFYEKAYRSSEQGSRTVTGTQYRYENIFPALATGHLYFGSPDAAKYYVGAGIGTYWIEQRTEVGLYAATNDEWHFGFAPEIGVVLPSGSTSWVLLARYNYALEAGDQPEQQWLTIQVGLQYN
jgi:opacity protein-like surface antigen